MRRISAGMAVVLLLLPLCSISVFAIEYYDIYDEETGAYYSAMYDEETGETWIDSTPIPYYKQGSEDEVGDGKYKGYNLYYEYLNQFSIHNDRSWWWEGTSRKGYTINWVGDFRNYSKATIKVPDKINRTDVIGIKGSCGFKAFDLNPENKHMKCVDNVIFSKDGKQLIAYAQYDKRREYIIPEGTEIIGYKALWSCENLHTVTIPDSVTEIMESALASTKYNLSLVNFYDFDVKIDKGAFSVLRKQSSELMLKSGVTVSLESQGNTISWNEVYGASYYEIYQKLSSGEYTLLGKTKSTAHTFDSIKPGVKYTFAVKPVAIIPAANYDKEKDEGIYPETFTIEGTMSEDVVVRG